MRGDSDPSALENILLGAGVRGGMAYSSLSPPPIGPEQSKFRNHIVVTTIRPKLKWSTLLWFPCPQSGDEDAHACVHEQKGVAKNLG